MSKQITQIDEVKVITPGKSVADQIVDLPLGSVVLIETGTRLGNTVLHRTGSDGWLSTRKLPNAGSRARTIEWPYYKNREVKASIDYLAEKGATFTLLDEVLT